MQVQVVYAVMRRQVELEPVVALLFCCRHLARDDLLANFLESKNHAMMLGTKRHRVLPHKSFGNHKASQGCVGLDVVKREKVGVLEKHPRGALAAQDSSEDGRVRRDVLCERRAVAMRAQRRASACAESGSSARAHVMHKQFTLTSSNLLALELEPK